MSHIEAQATSSVRNPARRAPSGAANSRAEGQIGRRELMLWLVGCFVANFVVQFLDFRSVQDFVVSVGAQNLLFWFACYVAIVRVWRSDGSPIARPLDIALVFAIGVLMLMASLVPHRSAIGLLATAAGLYLVWLNDGDRNLKAAGTVLLALSTNLVWGPLIFYLLTPQLLYLDAALVGGFLAELRPDIVWNGTQFYGPDQHTIALIGACSSFHNVTAAVLACVAFTMFQRTYWVRRDIVVVLGLCALMVLLNVSRLALLAWSPAAYSFWHEGYGVPLLTFAQTAVLGLAAFWTTATKARSS